ncbi:hypothetical protein [Roseofilum casamattae]|uniref:Uncharacterized protein n=1 Tax=Roseofilum casamattae BLCC-M143 TaxID=3022442 RepID=A0ABT7C0S0_9CYAN|nr:hypothetical protein [Roseofilum casamattae]MDJ1184281.1 hypothetical protein [Roseofilum casamattae BLCC-M143]
MKSVSGKVLGKILERNRNKDLKIGTLKALMKQTDLLEDDLL